MTLDQLRYLVAVVDHSLSASAAARHLRCSQPAISRQIQMLERELGFAIFDRAGRGYTRVTPDGRRVLDRAATVLREVQALRVPRRAVDAVTRSSISIATGQLQARHVLPAAIGRFRQAHPDVELHLHVGALEQSLELVREERADFALAIGDCREAGDLLRLPCHRLPLRLIAADFHPLATRRRPTLADIAAEPLLLQTFGGQSRAALLAAFEIAGLSPRIALNSGDADVVKAYARIGLGVGLIASAAWQPTGDERLVALDAGDLFEPWLTWLALPRRAVPTPLVYRFVEQLAPHLSRELIDAVREHDAPAEVDRLLADVHVPLVD